MLLLLKICVKKLRRHRKPPNTREQKFHISAYKSSSGTSNYFFPPSATAQLRPWPPSVRDCQITARSIPPHKKSTLCRSRCLHNTQKAQQRNIHVLWRIRTHDPKNQTAENLSLKKHGHRHRSDKTDTAENKDHKFPIRQTTSLFSQTFNVSQVTNFAKSGWLKCLGYTGSWGLGARVLLAPRQVVGCPRTESNKERHYQLTTPKRWDALLILSEEPLHKFLDQLIALTFLIKCIRLWS